MGIRTRKHVYVDGDATFEAYLAWDDGVTQPRPGVLVSHAWRGRSEFENGKAEDLARLGYVGFALDLYGRGVLGTQPEENRRLMQPFIDDRLKLQRHLELALREIRALPEVDESQVAAIGFCFGGLCVLDMARCGADLSAVASFHGLLTPRDTSAANRFAGKVLVMHGWDDPMAPPEQLVTLGKELSELGADWQIHAYGNTLHAFTNPAADDAANGLKFDLRANDRSWQSMQTFLAEAFRQPD
ncbi:MAG: dienelactone hydrolase family protein [Gammaproteobacteria bacterium]|nr:dienelactone hydrolase family protein [Gammaproteobacteria bacterium]MDH4313378.1 dienelactone hydrolase family protein [Gammaproteobacteria bacterium]MDH5213709.1 dienelactone hydrolase family protein [Gammaproteobacteria bacterium]